MKYDNLKFNRFTFVSAIFASVLAITLWIYNNYSTHIYTKLSLVSLFFYTLIILIPICILCIFNLFCHGLLLTKTKTKIAKRLSKIEDWTYNLIFNLFFLELGLMFISVVGTLGGSSLADGIKSLNTNGLQLYIGIGLLLIKTIFIFSIVSLIIILSIKYAPKIIDVKLVFKKSFIIFVVFFLFIFIPIMFSAGSLEVEINKPIFIKDKDIFAHIEIKTGGSAFESIGEINIANSNKSILSKKFKFGKFYEVPKQKFDSKYFEESYYTYTLGFSSQINNTYYLLFSDKSYKIFLPIDRLTDGVYNVSVNIENQWVYDDSFIIVSSKAPTP